MAHESSRPPVFIDDAAEANAQELDYANYLDVYGLSPSDVDQVVEFGNYTGTVATMLADERCPVGNVVAEAYKKTGIEGVESALTGLQALDSRFKPAIGEDTKNYHKGAVTREELLIKPDSSGEVPDFLVQ